MGDVCYAENVPGMSEAGNRDIGYQPPKDWVQSGGYNLRLWLTIKAIGKWVYRIARFLLETVHTLASMYEWQSLLEFDIFYRE